jgi:hypothetical protein
MQIIQSRRDFLAGASWAAAATVLGPRRPLADGHGGSARVPRARGDEPLPHSAGPAGGAGFSLQNRSAHASAASRVGS